MGSDIMILVFWMLGFKPTFSLSSFTFIKRLFSSSSLTAIRVGSSAYRRGQWHPTPVLLPEKSLDEGAWWAAVHGVAMSRTRLSDFTFTFHFHALEEEMATHSSVLAWKNPRDGGPWWAAIYGVAQSRTRLKRLQMVIAAMKLKDTYSLERKLWPT